MIPVQNQSHTLPWLVISGALTVVWAGALWGILDSTLVEEVISSSTWDTGSTSATLLREYVLVVWQWFLLIVMLRLAFEAVITSREVSGTTNLVLGTTGVIILHAVVILWALAVPEVISPMIDVAVASDGAQDTGFIRGVEIARDTAFVYVPALFLLVGDAWYLIRPIRNDAVHQYV